MNKLILLLLLAFIFIFPVLSVEVAFAQTENQNLGDASTNLSVTSLQRYLIQANAGPYSQSLKYSGEIGYFDSYTQTALIEFQKSIFIHPASGYYGTSTAEYISSHPLHDNFGAIILINSSSSTATPTPVILPLSNIKAQSVDISSWMSN